MAAPTAEGRRRPVPPIASGASTLLRRMPLRLKRVLQRVREVATEQQVEAYLVGGAVRDLLLGQPILDVDITVLGNAIAFGKRLARELGGELAAHGQLGTATVRVGEMRIDLATARAEEYPRPGALPRVRPGTLEEDLLRRDFTVNAMAVSLGTDFGRHIDLCGGAQDLARGLIRVLHQASFEDDPTRVLRAVRLAETRSLRLAPETRRLALEALKRGALDTLSGTRLRDQLVLTLEGARAGALARRLGALGFWQALHPGLRAEAAALRIITNLARMRTRVAAPPPCGWWILNLLALAQRLSAAGGAALAARLQLRAPEREAVVETLRLRGRLVRRLSAPALSPGRVWLLLRNVPVAVPVFLAAALPARTPAGARARRFLFRDRFAAPPLDGRALLRLGVPEGPILGKMLQQLTVARIEGAVHSPAEVAEWVRRRLPRTRKVD